ncbi:MAG: hypothetical protein JKY50_07885 [Oleispira sp.]|nr:hypothetical protein [Oleispira sp.]MBL4880212.1 hypothetical protein [Oleispira sp.]
MKQWNAYKERVLDRVRLCCEKNVWPFDYDRFLIWLGNFTDNTDSPSMDELVALYLLDRLVVRTTATAIAGYSRLIVNELRQAFIKEGILPKEISINELKKQLRTYPGSLGINFTPVTFEGDQGDSGPSLYRRLHPIYRTDATFKKEPKAIIYVDDCLGTGNQFDTFLKKVNPVELYPNSAIFYCPLIAYKATLERLRTEQPDITILPVEIIDEDVFPFSENEYGTVISQHLGVSISQLEEHYLKMFYEYCGAQGFSDYWSGYGGICMPIIFEWGCPNNIPGILHMDRSGKIESWQQLFLRRS